VMSATPEPVRRGRVPRAADQVGGGGDAGHADRGLAATALDEARDTLAAHQASDALARDADPAPAQHRVHPGCAIGLARVAVDRADRDPEPVVFELALAGRAPLGGIEARARYLEHPAQRGDRMIGPLRTDEAMHLAYLRPVSPAKKAALASTPRRNTP